ncbi:MAG: GntR family transcriptional regulator [Bacillota bacterium]
MDENMPFYMQVKNQIKNQVLMGELKPGDAIPSERKLKEKFSFSRATIRKAINQLCYEGYLIKIQGKGTFIAKHNLKNNLEKITAINYKKELNKEEKIEFKIIDQNLISKDKSKEIKLKITDNNKNYYSKRKVTINGTVVGIQNIYCHYDYISKINDEKINVLENLGDRILSETYIEKIDKDTSKILNLKKNSFALKNENKIFKGHNTIIYIESIYDGEKIKLTQDVKISKGGINNINTNA